MRSAFICVFLTLVVHNYRSRAENDEDFKPTPIPLIDWPSEKQEAPGTLHEIIKTETPQAVAAVPAHYWEDALRHSVYLTLVRDKIDQLIAKGAVISPDSKPDNNVSKEVDDHDLWEKIKTARFDRLKEEPIPPADVTILAKGRLLEDKDGFRFSEDDASKRNCSDNNCTKGVKAFWSVKRIRQGELYPGKYHYELTFSVTSQTSRKLIKPYENPVRTFTIKENSPIERPQGRNHEPRPPIQGGVQLQRPQRAVWIHKNLATVTQRPQTRGLDRIFSSLFSDEDNYEEPSYRYKHKTYVSKIHPHHTNMGFGDDRNLYQQKKQIQYHYSKPQPSIRYSHPPNPPSNVPFMKQHPYFQTDPAGNGEFVPPFSDNRYLPSNIVKTTRPAVLPTPIANYPPIRESTMEAPIKTRPNVTEHTTKKPDVETAYKVYHHAVPSQPMKVNYFTDHIRPPVYNAPPGVFVTMDKKPFKPMPPLKFAHSNKPQKHSPLDFRPSPQILDTQSADSDTISEAFRPITMNYTTSSVKHDSSKKVNNNRKPPKKHENIKSHRLTTIAPEIITAQGVKEEEEDDMAWVNYVGAFTKTTPIASHKDRGSVETTESIITTSEPVSLNVELSSTEKKYHDFEASSEEVQTTSTTSTTTTTTTTPKPKKRTRPPPKFTKTEKIKKHKRVTSTSTTTTTTKPTPKYTKYSKFTKKPSEDLTPQASSAAISEANSVLETKKHKAPVTSTTTTTTSTPRPTTTTKTTTTSNSPSTTKTTVETEQPVVTTQPKSKNRFRQSTLMQKGTSVNHDKWSTPAFEKNRTNSVLSNHYIRRKASKFTGYIPSSTPRTPEVERDREDHKDHAFHSDVKQTSSTSTESETTAKESGEDDYPATQTTESINQDTNIEEAEEIEIEDLGSENDLLDPNDDSEYIFPTASTIHEVKSHLHNIEEQPPTTELTVVASPHSTGKNKSKCKKKKHNNLSNPEEESILSKPANTTLNTTTTTTTQAAVTSDIFEELFGGFTMDDMTEKPKIESTTPPLEPKESESEQHHQYVPFDAELEDFLHSLDQRSPHTKDDNDDESIEDYEDERDNEDSPYNNKENLNSRQLQDEYYDDFQENQEDRPASLLELMAME